MDNSKKKIRTIKQQLSYAIEKRNMPGRSKHQDKLDGTIKNHDIIYSCSEYSRLKDVTTDLYNFILNNYKELNHKYLSDIPLEVIESFYESKINDCTAYTIKSYKSSVDKLMRIANKTYNINLEWDKVKAPVSKKSETKIRDIRINKKVCFECIHLLKQNSNSYRGLLVCFMAGLRVEEAVNLLKEDIDLERNVVVVRSGKGGKYREIPIKENQTKYYIKIISNIADGDKICDIQADSLNKAFKRAIEMYDKKHGTSYFDDVKSSKSAVHMIRKTFATEEFNTKEKELNMKDLLKKFKMLQKLV